MLNPHVRLALSDALTPPPGFTLDHAVGTTFTLDLETALTVPLALAAKRVETAGDPLSILDSLRRTEQHIDIFAQAGQISMGQPSNLVTLLERSVHQVAQRVGLFHPKVWFMRFAAGAEVSYRFISASRNLTQDRSWDVVVQLDGVPGDAAQRDRLRQQNLPMADLIRALPEMTVHSLATSRKKRIRDLADQWESVSWDYPEGVRELNFHALGFGGHAMPKMDAIRTLVISPFLTDEGLAKVRGHSRRETHVLSRPETLDRLAPESFDKRLACYIFDEAADLTADEDSETVGKTRELLSGLHAKVVVHDQSDRSARVLLGSANATEAAWTINTEVMVEIVGSGARFGVHRTLESLGELKESYSATGGESASEREEAAHHLEEVLRKIATLPIFMRLSGDGPCEARVWAGSEAAEHEGVELQWQLLGGANTVSGSIPSGETQAHLFEVLQLEQVTPFIVITARQRGIIRRTIVIAHLLGDFERRRTAVLSAHIADRESFIRLLTMMLDLAGLGRVVEASDQGLFGFDGAASGDSAGLMEALAKALGYGADAITDVQRIVDFISGEEERAAELLPEGFVELWHAVQNAYERTQRGVR